MSSLSAPARLAPSFPEELHNYLMILCLAALAVTLIWFFPTLAESTDMHYFETLGREVISSPGAELSTIRNSYPPLFVAWLALVSAWPAIPFAAAWLISFYLLVSAVALFAAWCLAPADRWSFLAALLIAAPVLGIGVLFSRYDYMVALFLFLSWRTHRQRFYFASSAFLVTAGLLKFLPVLAWPLLYWSTPPAQRRGVLAGALVALMVGTVIPWLVLGPALNWHITQSALSFQSGRGFHVESTWAAAHLLLAGWRDEPVTIGFHHYAYHDDDFVPWISYGVQLGLVATAWLLTAQARRRQIHATPELFLPYILILFTLIFLLGTVFSPQFLVWTMPISLAWLGESFFIGQRRNRLLSPFFLVVASCMLTQWIYPYHYSWLLSQESLWPAIVLNVRNVLLVFFVGWLWAEIRRQSLEHFNPNLARTSGHTNSLLGGHT